MAYWLIIFIVVTVMLVYVRACRWPNVCVKGNTGPLTHHAFHLRGNNFSIVDVGITLAQEVI